MLLRQLELKDTAELYALVHISRKDLSNLAWAETATFESTADYIAKQDFNNRKYGIYEEFGNGLELIGVIGSALSGDSYLLGYWMGTPYRGQGHMKDALKRLTGFVSTWGKPMKVKIKEENLKSQAVVKACGFKFVEIEEYPAIKWLWFSLERR